MRSRLPLPMMRTLLATPFTTRTLRAPEMRKPELRMRPKRKSALNPFRGYIFYSFSDSPFGGSSK